MSGELAGPPPLGNMSCRPRVAVVHPSDDPARQLVPALRARLVMAGRARSRSVRGPLRLPGLPRGAIPTDPARATRRLEAIADAVPALLGLPSVIPLAPGGSLPDTIERTDPLLAFALLARRSGAVWLGRRTPATEGLATGGTVTLLVPATVRARILAALDAPGWAERVLERAIALETTALETTALEATP